MELFILTLIIRTNSFKDFLKLVTYPFPAVSKFVTLVLFYTYRLKVEFGG